MNHEKSRYGALQIAALYDCRVPYLIDFFARATYPWQLLSQIHTQIAKLHAEGIPGYRMLREGVLCGEGVQIAPTAVIEGSAVLGAGTVLRPGAYLRGNVITGADCVIGNSSELKNCILLDRVQLPHYNYVGDSVIGKHAHMGAGAVCSNLKADGRDVVIHASDGDIETALRKAGAFLGDFAEIGCGCVLNPGTVVGKNTSVYPLVALRGVIAPDCIVKAAGVCVAREKFD